MKFYLIILTVCFLFGFNLSISNTTEELEEQSYALLQDEEEEDWESDSYEIKDSPMKYYKDKYEKDYDMLLEEVYQAVKAAITEDMNCMIITETTKTDDDGFLKAVIKSDFCILAIGSDTTMPVMKRYSKDFPVIRGGVWENGRIQYKFLLKENEDGSTHILLKAELSGREQYVTRKVQFWESNGLLEKEMFDMIDRNLGLEPNNEWDKNQ